MMSKRLLLIGGGGHCASCIDVISDSKDYEIAGIVDNYKDSSESILNYPILGKDEDLPTLFEDCTLALITVGHIADASLRISLYELVTDIGFELPVIQASTAYVSKSAEIMSGSIIMHKALINTRTSIGVNCIINSKALIEHDVVIGNHTHISTGAIINGNCRVGNNCFIGSGAVVRNGITITDGCLVGAGSLVLKDLTTPGIYYGNPVRLHK